MHNACWHNYKWRWKSKQIFTFIYLNVFFLQYLCLWLKHIAPTNWKYWCIFRGSKKKLLSKDELNHLGRLRGGQRPEPGALTHQRPTQQHTLCSRAVSLGSIFWIKCKCLPSFCCCPTLESCCNTRSVPLSLQMLPASWRCPARSRPPKPSCHCTRALSQSRSRGNRSAGQHGVVTIYRPIRAGKDEEKQDHHRAFSSRGCFIQRWLGVRPRSNGSQGSIVSVCVQRCPGTRSQVILFSHSLLSEARPTLSQTLHRNSPF